MKTYILKPTMTFKTVTDASAALKPRDKESAAIADAIAPAAKTKSSIALSLPPRQPLPSPVIDPNKPVLKLGLDVHLIFIMAAIQRGRAAPQTPRKFSAFELAAQIKLWVAEGFQVFCVQESCGFGFSLHRQLVEANVNRKNDKADARVLCKRLTRFLDGDRNELHPIRIPTEIEQRKRELTRRRKFLQNHIRSLATRRGLDPVRFARSALSAGPACRWWGARNWKKLSLLDPWLLDVLSLLRELIVALEAQVAKLEIALLERVKDQVIPKGLGEISLVTLDGEICDWNRFYNRKQMGSYTGCCPGEHSSGGKRRMGSIDRMGNRKENQRQLLRKGIIRSSRERRGRSDHL
jgi:transposase